jgi:uncharacterized protein YndB with AHSA1/START domain
MRKKILIGVPVVLLLLVAVFASVVAMQPNDFKVTRSAQIAAPPEKVFEQVNDFHNWDAWSPWAKLDPDAKNSFDGPTEGKGASFAWSGNNQIGEGHMTILDSRPNELVSIDLVFDRPKQDPALTEFTLQPEGDQTNVTWTMSGKHTFMSKAICMFMNMDKMVGGSFEEGLAKMKEIVETDSSPMATENSENKEAESIATEAKSSAE